ncbi:MAG: N-acetyltransferase [Deinococcales bacterium]
MATVEVENHLDKEWEIRQATLADVGAMVALEALFPSDRLSAKSLRHLIRKGHADVLIISFKEQPSQILADAVLLYRKGSRSARLYSLVVDPQHRGKKLAQSLLRHLAMLALNKGCEQIRLELREDNQAALKLYEKQGYHFVERIEGYYQDDSPALRMLKTLSHP